MQSKELFLKQNDLRQQALAVVKQEWFSQFLIYARGALTETQGITPEALRGAKQFENILLSLCDEDEEIPNEFMPLVNHDIDNPRPVGVYKPTKARKSKR